MRFCARKLCFFFFGGGGGLWLSGCTNSTCSSNFFFLKPTNHELRYGCYYNKAGNISTNSARVIRGKKE